MEKLITLRDAAERAAELHEAVRDLARAGGQTVSLLAAVQPLARARLQLAHAADEAEEARWAEETRRYESDLRKLAET